MEMYEIVNETRKQVLSYAINDFIDDLKAYSNSVMINAYIQPQVSKWYNSEGKLLEKQK